MRCEYPSLSQTSSEMIFVRLERLLLQYTNLYQVLTRETDTAKGRNINNGSLPRAAHIMA